MAGVIFNGSWGTNVWPLYGVAGWPFFRGSVTVEVYVSSIRTRAFGRYIEGGCCRGVTVMRGSTVHVTLVDLYVQACNFSHIMMYYTILTRHMIYHKEGQASAP